MQNVLKLRRMKNMEMERKITVLKAIAPSKVACIRLITVPE